MKHAILTGLLALMGAQAHAAADLKMELTGPQQLNVGTGFTIHMKVQNIGNSRANSVEARVALPVGAQLAAVPSGCVLQSNSVKCRMSRLNSGASIQADLVLLGVPAPAILVFQGSSSTTTNESTFANNNPSLTVSISSLPPQISLQPGHQILGLICSGGAPFTFAACGPSSTQPLNFQLDVNGQINTWQPDYAGLYVQNDPTHIRVTVVNNYTLQAEAIFEGSAVDARCFEGTTSYPMAGQPWYGAFRFCLP